MPGQQCKPLYNETNGTARTVPRYTVNRVLTLLENVGRIENVGFPYTMLFAPFPCALSSLVLCCAMPEPRSVCTVCVLYMNVEYCSYAMASCWSYMWVVLRWSPRSVCVHDFATLFVCIYVRMYGWWSKCEESVELPRILLIFGMNLSYVFFMNRK